MIVALARLVAAPAEDRSRVDAFAPAAMVGSVTLAPTQVGRDAGRIADEIVSHLTGLMDSTVKVTLGQGRP